MKIEPKLFDELKKVLSDFGDKYLLGEELNRSKLSDDLRNYNEVLKNCQVGEPVFLTKNGRGKFVVMDIEDYEREKAEKKLLMKLQEAEEAVKDERAWMSLDELKKSVGV